MAVDGKWEIVINSPLGAQKATLDLTADGASLTGSQQAAILDIEHDLASPDRMLRLLQGDVGSGKTLVALMAA
ncbi:MAG TPA: hypothetical protein VFQ52_00520, partial [Rhizomicrobium sp.]|nr:hypothetical protein [Rhizomicrobium sp.]